MIVGIHHVALVVRNLAAAQRFFGAVAGMRQVSVDGLLAVAACDQDDRAEGIGELQQALLQGRNGYLRLLAPQWPSDSPKVEHNPINRPGIRHLCVQNIDCAVLEHTVLANGGSLIAAPVDLGTGNQYAYARDPEGNIVEIEGLPYAPPGEANWLGHVALVTMDMDRSLAFYRGLLGTQLRGRSLVGPRPQFDHMGGLVGARLEGAWLPAGNLLLELWQFHAPHHPEAPARRFLDPGYSYICLQSDDIAADADRLVALGGGSIGNVRGDGALRSIHVRDPEGNCIVLLEIADAAQALSISALPEPGLCARVDAGR